MDRIFEQRENAGWLDVAPLMLNLEYAKLKAVSWAGRNKMASRFGEGLGC